VLTDYDKYVFSIWSKGYKPTWPWWENISLPHTKCHPLYIVCTYLCDNFDVPMYLTFSLVPFLWCRVSGGFYLLFFLSTLLSVSDVAIYEIRGILFLLVFVHNALPCFFISCYRSLFSSFFSANLLLVIMHYVMSFFYPISNRTWYSRAYSTNSIIRGL
jgi:hypothetical protein